jgi:hypothetical protein
MHVIPTALSVRDNSGATPNPEEDGRKGWSRATEDRGAQRHEVQEPTRGTTPAKSSQATAGSTREHPSRPSTRPPRHSRRSSIDAGNDTSSGRFTTHSDRRKLFRKPSFEHQLVIRQSPFPNPLCGSQPTRCHGTEKGWDSMRKPNFNRLGATSQVPALQTGLYIEPDAVSAHRSCAAVGSRRNHPSQALLRRCHRLSFCSTDSSASACAVS